jgi:PilZ domain
VKERREFTREQADWLADIYTDDTIYTAPVRNLSLGGAELIRPPLWKPKSDNIIKICFSNMTATGGLELRMQVCWMTENSVGLKYHDIEMMQKIKLNKLLSGMAKTAAFESANYVM